MRGEGTTVLKLGGSVLTEKDRPETLDRDAIDRAADAIGDTTADGSSPSLVVVHGGGSFGHHRASEHGVTTTEGTRDPETILSIHGAMTALNRFVIERLLDRDVPAIPIDPLSAGHRDADGDLALPEGTVRTLVDEGFVPVLHGDVIAHEGAGMTVVSGDEIVASLATSLDADRVGICSTVPGVLDRDGRVIERVESYEAVVDVLGGSDAPDVSGGMAGKVRELLALESQASIFGLGELEAFLAGDRPGTTIG